MHLPKFSKEEACIMFNCSIENLNNQYLKNAQAFEKMYLKAVATGKKVNGYTEQQLDEMTARYYQLAQD